MPDGLADTPEPPYYAVVFTSQRTEGDDGYAAMGERMVTMARTQPGFLGVESVRGADGVGITVSYWSDLDAIAGWKRDAAHAEAQRGGRERWYRSFRLRVARVERQQSFDL